jgi:hypothetical protein
LAPSPRDKYRRRVQHVVLLLAVLCLFFSHGAVYIISSKFQFLAVPVCVRFYLWYGVHFFFFFTSGLW